VVDRYLVLLTGAGARSASLITDRATGAATDDSVDGAADLVHLSTVERLHPRKGT
jgi:hypothetical protein